MDIEDNCFGIYKNGEFIFKDFDAKLKDVNAAWRYSHIIRDNQCTYASLLLRDEKLENYSSNPTKFLSYSDLMSAQKSAALTAKIDISDMCFFDILPDHLVHSWFSLREEAIRNVIIKKEKSNDYNILEKIHVLTEVIARQELNFGENVEKIKYDMFSSATGRLTTKRGSFPILSLNKEDRALITPMNDMFLELDLNGAEIRTLLSLCDKPQPDYDIHEFNKNMAAQDLTTRAEVKARFFAWLYNPESKDYNLEKLYNKNIYKKYYNNGYIETPFGRKLEVDERKALNYLTQSTTSDIVLENAYKIFKLLENHSSRVAFTMHDSVVLDFAREDHHLVGEIKKLFEENMFGRFLASVKIGKNFGNLKEIQVG